MTDELIAQMEDGFKAAMEQPIQPDRVIFGKYVMSPGMATPENLARIQRGEAPLVPEGMMTPLQRPVSPADVFRGRW